MQIFDLLRRPLRGVQDQKNPKRYKTEDGLRRYRVGDAAVRCRKSEQAVRITESLPNVELVEQLHAVGNPAGKVIVLGIELQQGDKEYCTDESSGKVKARLTAAVTESPPG